MSRSSQLNDMPIRSKLLTLLLCSTALAGAPAFAQAGPAASKVDVIIVTAEKREENIQDVPMSIQALDGGALERQNVTNFQDYAKLMPSVAFQTQGPNQTSVYMRGVSSGDNANHSGPLPSVGVYLDEQPITTIGGTLDIHVYDIARVEVLPGPQGTLYGASSEAGTLRIITNKPDPAKFAAGFNIEANTVAHGDQGYVAEGFVNAPISDNAAVRIVAWDQHDAGYIDNVPGARTFPTSGATVANTGPGGVARDNFNTADTLGARAALKINLNDNWTITPSVIAQDQRSKGVFGFEPSIGDLKVWRFQPDETHDKWVQSALTVTGKIGRYDLTYSGGYFDRRFRQDTDYTDYSIFYDLAYGSGAYWQDSSGNPLPLPLQSIKARDHFTKNSHEIRLASPGDDRLRFIGGLFFERQTHLILQDYVIDGFGPQISPPGWPGTIWLTDQMRVDRDDAAFVEASFDVTKKFTLTAGIRAYEFKNQLHGFYGFGSGYNALTGFGSGMGDVGQNCVPGASFRDAPCVNLSKDVSGSGETHKVNATYKFTDDILTYFTYSTGYRPGGLNRNGSFGPYGEDKLSNYEAGWKTSWLGHTVTFNGAIFYEDWDRFQFSFLGPNSLTIVENAPKATIKGVETSLDWRPVDSLTISGSAAYTDAQLAHNFCGTDQTTGLLIPNCANVDAVALEGAQLPYTPKIKANLTARYVFPIGDWDGHFQGAVAYQSRNEVGLRTEDIGFLGKMPSYTTVDFSFGASKDGRSLELFVKNALDERGQINRYTPCTISVCAAVVPGEPSAVYVVPTQPRLIGVRFGQTF
jgi:outer membrane receptor protein involved in Fe transport